MLISKAYGRTELDAEVNLEAEDAGRWKLASEIAGRSDLGFSTDSSMVCGAGSSANDEGGGWRTESDCAGRPDFEVADEMVRDWSNGDSSTKIVTQA